MIRISVSLDNQEHALARKKARALRISMGEFVRRAVRDKLPVSNEAPWMRFAGMVASGDPNSSQSIDEIIYGSKD